MEDLGVKGREQDKEEETTANADHNNVNSNPNMVPVVCLKTTPLTSVDCAEEFEDKNETFLQWLIENGAQFPKIEWPSNNTVGGVRGAVALDDIETNEHMVIIPEHLMMSPAQFRESETLGPILKEHPELLHTDMALSLFVMQEMNKKEDSFYWPFLRILPEPLNATDWNEAELAEIQDSKLCSRARFRREHLKTSYRRTFDFLFEKFPDTIKPETHTFELFKKAWGTIQARAFGRWLPWTALVPFADCLNHGNLQTKYDYNQDGNKLFRLFPSGNNRYPRGSEVFNSYGRRTNENLLTEYGFAIQYNEWDTVVVQVQLPLDDPSYIQKRQLMLKLGNPTSRSFHLRAQDFSDDGLSYCRLVCLQEDELHSFPDITREKLKSTRVSRQNELDALALFKQCILRKSSDFLTTLEEDEILLSQVKECGDRRKSAIYYRMTKKNIIRVQTEVLDHIIAAVESIEWGSSETFLEHQSQIQIEGIGKPMIQTYFQKLLKYFSAQPSTSPPKDDVVEVRPPKIAFS